MEKVEKDSLNENIEMEKVERDSLNEKIGDAK